MGNADAFYIDIKRVRMSRPFPFSFNRYLVSDNHRSTVFGFLLTLISVIELIQQLVVYSVKLGAGEK